MAVITNNISGSSSGGSRIGITGSVIISNTSEPFPQPSSDTVFFVSGSENAKSVFGGAAKISGSLITDGNVQIGDSSNDTLTINASTVSIPNNLNFDSNTLYIDSTNNRIGIGKVPSVTLDVSGSLSTNGSDQPSTIFNGDTFVSGAFGVSGTIKAPQGLSGSLTKLTDGTSYLIAGSGIQITTGSSGAITITNDGTVGDITAVTAGTGLTGGGTSGAVTLDINDSVVATISGSTFTGVTKHISGLSGSLTKLTDGTSYLIAGGGTTITTGSSGAVTISSPGVPGGSTTQVQYNNAGVFAGSSTLTFNSANNILASLNVSATSITASNLTVTSNGSISGNATVAGSTTTNTLFVNTGNVVGSPGAGANVLSLLSSGNIVMKLDVNNDSPGHKFDVQDYLGISQFFVGENGNAELSGSLVTTGSLTVSGSATLGIVSEVLSGSNAIGGTFVFDTTRQSIFYVNNATSNITANFTNVPTVDNRIISTTVILSQSTTARIVSAVQIAGVASTINWANNVTPTGNSGKQDIFGFNLIRSGSAWKTLGQMTTYG